MKMRGRCWGGCPADGVINEGQTAWRGDCKTVYLPGGLRRNREEERKEKTPCKENHTFYNMEEEREVPPWDHSLPGKLEQSKPSPCCRSAQLN